MLLISLEIILLAKKEFKCVTNKWFRKFLATQQNLFYEDVKKTQTIGANWNWARTKCVQGKHCGTFLSDRGLNIDKLEICIEDRRLRNASLSVVNNYMV